ncbi:hypothetical protein [Wolbachia endosymbiont (group A) of Lasioglossum fulvicorne]|uniref:hypothetical protein n=1 Tax=Wolbachia endosymbiont (group A) of Lasioglossum fulvicorne TaxID=3066201 RepID=UPI00333E93E6
MRKIYDAFESYGESEHLSNDKAIENLVKKFQKSIKDAKENKCMFSVPSPILSNKLSIIDYSILVLHHLMKNDAHVTEIGKSKLMPLWLEMSALVSKGNNVSKEASGKLQSDILQNRESYLSTLKQIVSDSIENGDKEGIVAQKDNEFYCVKCPEESVITPAKFMNLKEFKNLEYGALQMGEGDNVIRIQNGQYCDMKGKVKMTFKVDNDEKIEMILSSEKAESFGKIMVHMDDKSCEIFLKYREELEKEPRISKVVEAAKSFAQKKSSEVSPPLSNMKSADISQHSQSSGQSVSS